VGTKGGQVMSTFTDQVQSAWNWLTASAQWHGANGIPHRLLQHLEFSGIALGAAVIIALPLGLLVGHTGRGGFLVAGAANALRSLPTLGLVILAAIYATGDITYPVLVPLALLAIAPILVNTYEGIRQVDPEARDAAVGMGMTRVQLLLRAEIPMAMPLILLGLRTAAIQVVATATVAAYPGLGGLGRFIMDGLATQNYNEVVGGAVVVVLLALAVQFLFTGIRRLVLSPGLRRTPDRS
jgi:osmoprotectant transport system permease protein